MKISDGAMERLADNQSAKGKPDTVVEVPSSDTARRHYKRLRGIGYTHAAAEAAIVSIYKDAESYRDVLVQRKNPLVEDAPAAEETIAQPAIPTVGQKVVTGEDFGRVSVVGTRFVSIEWLNSGKRERIALSRFNEMVQKEQAAALPVIRTASRAKEALREG